MFRLADQGLVWWPVELTQSTGPDQVETVTAWFQYRIYTREELREQERAAVERIAAKREQMAAKPEAGAGEVERHGDDLLALFETVTERQAGDTADLLERITDWRGLGDGDTEEPFSRDRLGALLGYDPIYKQLRTQLFAASREAPRKNSQPGPGGLPAPAQA
ncbi:MAG: hypothetical protein ACREPV_01175 [Lysobacter sp.]